LFADWEKRDVPQKNVSTVAHKEKTEVYLLDRPGSQQSIVFAGHVAPPKANPDEFAIDAMNTVLGGSFSSRLNMNLREDKHWSYGARSIILPAKGQRPLIAYASVQMDKTDASMREVMAELTGIRADRPITADELAKAKDLRTLTLPGRWETNGAVSSDIAQMERFGFPNDYYDTYAANIRALTAADVSDVARDVLNPKRLVWVIVGDRAAIEEGIKQLDLGPIYFVDADGNVVE
jgi:zinc protease